MRPGSVPGQEGVNLDGTALARDFAEGMIGPAVECNHDPRNQGLPCPAKFIGQALQILPKILFRVY